LAGAFSGPLLTAIQQITITPLLRAAEVAEAAAIESSRAAHVHASIGHAHEAWAPSSALENLLATAVSNTVLATGFALLLGSAMYQWAKVSWRAGLLWGAVGYAVFFVAPSLGLTPELPGTAVAPLRDRALWWCATVLFSATGLWLVVFSEKSALRVIGLVLITVPHAIGPPQPAINAPIHSMELTEEFVRATYFANAAFWLALGGLVGCFLRRGEVAAVNNVCVPTK